MKDLLIIIRVAGHYANSVEHLRTGLFHPLDLESVNGAKTRRTEFA
jgi:hypothetical protein